MHSPETLVYSCRLFDVWHIDPCKGVGGDDTCGWFKRARHGDQVVLKRIEKRFEEDWDRTWTYEPEDDDEDKQKRTYARGYFNPNGVPRMSVAGIILNLFFLAANEHFKCDGRTNWKKSKRFMREHLFDIMQFAENPVDSMFDAATMAFGNSERREERIKHFAAIIYGWILRADQNWWQHPRWHIHHWQIIFHPVAKFKRWAFSRCCKCGKGFAWGESPCSGNWNSGGPEWFKSEKHVYHMDCEVFNSKPCAAE